MKKGGSQILAPPFLGISCALIGWLGCLPPSTTYLAPRLQVRDHHSAISPVSVYHPHLPGGQAKLPPLDERHHDSPRSSRRCLHLAGKLVTFAQPSWIQPTKAHHVAVKQNVPSISLSFDKAKPFFGTEPRYGPTYARSCSTACVRCGG